MMEDFSVLNARDQSITGWRRPLPDRHLIVKDLLSIFEAESSRGSPSKQHLKVYLRLKPILSKDGVASVKSFTILDEHTLCTCAPPDSITYKNQGPNITHQFKFTKIFGPDAGQKELFDQCVSENVKDFVVGNNSLIFAYGTTNAGKTYTVQGKATEPGLVPRALDLLFKRIQGKESYIGRYKPEKVDEIIELDNEAIARDAEHKQMILQWDWDKHQHAEMTRDGDELCSSNSSDFISSAFREMQKTISEEMTSVEEHKEGDVVFSVWVSYAEIYNDFIYDLLETAPGIGGKRVPLKLSLDANGNVYIRDLRQIHVCSGDEAFQVMVYGKKHLQVAATKMNSTSSRSHSVFTIKLVRYVKSEEQPTHARVSSISFCDLAGAERVKKTLNVGDRLKESTNINTSLHVLGRCFATIKDNQSTKFKKQIPFRESKLTRLFQRALQGQESVMMVVNINLSTVLFDESMHVLKFSAIAKQIVLQTPIKRARRAEKKKSRFSSLALCPSKSICWENPFDEEAESRRPSTAFEDLSAQNEALMEKISKLHEDLREEKRKNLTLERDLRITLTDQFEEILEKKEKHWKERLRAAEERNEEMSTWRINQLETYYEDLLHKKRKRVSRGDLDESTEQDEEGLVKDVALELEEARQAVKDLEEALELEKQNSERLKSALQESRRERDALAGVNSQLKFSLAHTENVMKNNKNLLEASSRSTDDEYVQELKRQLAHERATVATKMEQIENLKNLLDEAREDVRVLSKEKEEAEEEAYGFEQELAEKVEELNDLKTKMEELEDIRNHQTKTLEAYEQKEIEATRQYTLRIEELESQLKSLSVNEAVLGEQEQLDGLKSELSDVRKELEEAQLKLTEYDDLKKLLAELQNSTEEKDAQISLLNQRKLNLEEELQKASDDREEELQKLNEQLQEFEGDIRELQRLKQRQEDLILSLKKEKEELTDFVEAEKAELKEEIRKLEARLQEESTEMRKKEEKLEEEAASLQSSRKELERLTGERERLAGELKELHRQLEELVESKQQQKEVMTKELSQRDEKHEMEIKAMQTDLKKSLQKNVKLEETVKKLEEELKKSHDDSARMEQEVKNALHQSQLAEKKSTSTDELVRLLSTAREEANQHKAELQRLLQDKKLLEAALLDKDKEFETFTANRDALVTRYENEFKKFKEEAERDKKEIATLTATLYKNTPTPNKKQYEAEIYRLEAEICKLETEIYRLKEELEKEKDKNVENRSVSTSGSFDVSGKGCDEVPAPRRRGAVKKSTASLKDSQSSKGSTEDVSHASVVFAEPPKSARRTRRKELVESVDNFTVPVVPLTPTPTEEGSESGVRKSNRKKLYARPNADNFDSENTEPVELQILEPMTPQIFTKNLRSRSRRM